MKGNKSYSESFQREVVRQIKAGFYSKEEARRKYDIRNRSAIINWIRKFDDNNILFMKYNKLSKEDLINRIKELEHLLEDEQIRAVGYSKMIDIAEDQLKITIRKKPITKQSKC